MPAYLRTGRFPARTQVRWHAMHLKSLTLKGFKSFASPTTLRFEPGITCVVGPNGSGKSNVVDALAWVMGEQGAKTLRGGKMEDVIFAGTSSRAPLGRAEVTVTIDNSDNALPIEYSEVSITRRMFRDGGSEYEINGSQLPFDGCAGAAERLRHRPRDARHRRAGQARPRSSSPAPRTVGRSSRKPRRLKHRKRKEKAVRKLDAMSANLARLTDLTTELRRQLKPLGRQAEMARRAQTIQADLRDARLRLAADDLVTRQAEFDDTDQAEAALRREHDETVDRLDAATVELTPTSRRSPRCPSAPRPRSRPGSGCRRWPNGSARRSASPASAPSIWRPNKMSTGGPDPDALDAEADEVAAQEQQLLDELADSRDPARRGPDRAGRARRVAAEAERAHLAAVRAEADRREGLARLAGQVETMRARVESIDERRGPAVRRHRGGRRPGAAGQGRVRDRAGPGR